MTKKELLERERIMKLSDNKYTLVVYRKLRSLNKKLTKIESLEKQNPKTLNPDQLESIASKPKLLRQKEDVEEIMFGLKSVMAEDQKEEKKEVEVKENTVEDSVTQLLKLFHVSRHLKTGEPSVDTLVQSLNEKLNLNADVNFLKQLKNLSNMLGGMAFQDQVSRQQLLDHSVGAALKYLAVEQSEEPCTGLYYDKAFAAVNSIHEMNKI